MIPRPLYALFLPISCWALLLPFLFLYGQAAGQTDKGKPPAKNQELSDLKVLDEHKDGKGNIVRVIQYYKGSERITETAIIPIHPVSNIRIPINPDTLNKDSVLIVVTKSKYNLEVYYHRRLIRAYKAVFGPKPLEDKRVEGDRNTPEGWFTIKTKNPSSKYDKFLLLSYPNDSAVARFSRLKAMGKLPVNARIGSDVGIHGIWKGGDDLIEKGIGWTDGCIALKNKDVEELYTLTGAGTRVFIRK
jgi:hypothetical protein